MKFSLREEEESKILKPSGHNSKVDTLETQYQNNIRQILLGHKNLIAPEPVLMRLLDEVGEGKAHQTPHNIT